MLHNFRPFYSLQNVKKYSYLIGLHLYEILLKMTNKRPLILVTNDDGINAPRIIELLECVLMTAANFSCDFCEVLAHCYRDK